MKTLTVNGRETQWNGSFDAHIKTNYRPRPLVSYAELTSEAAAEFDYMLPHGIDYNLFRNLRDSGVMLTDTFTAARFFRFRGEWYDSQEFEVSPYNWQALGWDGWQTESAFSAVLLRYFTPDGYEYDNMVVVGYAHW